MPVVKPAPRLDRLDRHNLIASTTYGLRVIRVARVYVVRLERFTHGEVHIFDIARVVFGC
tara:strand:- start:1484 stop:1663 length:180 start_codon:yes stop_codon:yes gene_type:complete